MCGITAMFARNHNDSVSEALLLESLKKLEHRGPDSRHHLITHNGRVGLGHTRLSIIDLFTGDQPISNETGSIHIIVNGEFYDFERIRGELEDSGHQFRTKSDSEIALHLYEKFSTLCLSQLRGEFAFVLWDEANKLLFAARDRFGIKPLFYTVYKGTLYLSSEVKALFAAGIPSRWDHESFFQYTGSVTFQQNRTLFKNIFQVPPGHFLLATEQDIRIVPYWDFNFLPPDAISTMNDGEWIEKFRETLDEAVRIRMRADVPVGCYLSGGLDSSAVLSLAAPYSSIPINTFTLALDQKEYNEENIAREMAEHAGAKYYPIPVKQSDLADNFSDAIYHSEMICVNPHGVGKFLLSKAVNKAGFKVVYTGEGADEILGGYVFFRRDMLLYNNQGQDKSEVLRLLEEMKKSNLVSHGLTISDSSQLPLDNVKNILGFVPSWFEGHASMVNKMSPLLSKGFVDEFKGRDPLQLFLAGLPMQDQLAGRDPVNQSIYLWAKSGLPNYILNVLGDRMEMAHSIEGRVPFLDHHLVELMGRMPVSLKIRGMKEKYVLREAVKPLIPETVYKREKHPFLAPPASLSPDEKFHELVQDTLRGPTLSLLPFYNQKSVTALLDQIPEMDMHEKIATEPVLMGILSACVLHEKFKL